MLASPQLRRLLVKMSDDRADVPNVSDPLLILVECFPDM